MTVIIIFQRHDYCQSYLRCPGSSATDKDHSRTAPAQT